LNAPACVSRSLSLSKKIGYVIPLLLTACLIAGCATKARSQVATVYKEEGLASPGRYNLKFLLDGKGTLPEYLLNQQTENPELAEFDIPGLEKLFRIAYFPLFLPIQPGVPLCNLETNFKHCKGIELLADFEIFEDDTVVLHSHVLYHVNIRLEKGESSFFRTVKAQRDRGDFALPRNYYTGALVEAIQKALPILQEIATDYPKYIKEDNREIEIELILEEAREISKARKNAQDMKDTAGFGSGAIFSALPNISLLAGATVSALNSGGRTFWQVLKEEREFDLYKNSLELNDVNFSYAESSKRNFTDAFRRLFEAAPDIMIRKITIRLRTQETHETKTPQARPVDETPLASGGGDESSTEDASPADKKGIPDVQNVID